MKRLLTITAGCRYIANVDTTGAGLSVGEGIVEGDAKKVITGTVQLGANIGGARRGDDKTDLIVDGKSRRVQGGGADL